MENNKDRILEPNVTPAREVMETQPMVENVVVDETGIIDKETKIAGNITTKGHLLIHGEILGNIAANGNVVVTGNIAGDVSCTNIKFSDCKARTNVTAREDVEIERESRVEGTIICKRITVDGMLKGDIEADEVSIFQTARILGNIVSKTLSMEPGAEVQGNLRVVR